MLYLDNNSTTPIDPEVLDAMLPYLKEEYGNPSSRHYTLAKHAELAVEQAREQVASFINAKPKEIIFTSGASESNNFIIKGVADYQKYYLGKGNHMITSTVEHKSVLQACHFLDGTVYDNRNMNRFSQKFGLLSSSEKKIDRGYEVTFLPVNENAQVIPADFEKAIKNNSILASFMWGNNETGALNEIAELSAIAQAHNILFHTDATQAIGRTEVDMQVIPADFLSFSAHKLYGPKGIGAAYIRQNGLPTKLTALIHGGQQESGYRSGTSSVHNIVGFGKSCELAKKNLTQTIAHLQDLEFAAKKALRQKYKDIIFIADHCDHLPGVISAIIPGIVNELFIQQLSEKIALSSGSACGIGQPSYVIKEIQQQDHSNHFLRMSFNKFHSRKDIDLISLYM